MGPDFSKRLNTALASVRKLSDFKADIALVSGTGLSGLLDKIEAQIVIPYSTIAQFPLSTAPSHKGEFILGTISGVNIVAQNGRFHAYEGWSSDDIVLPVYLMRALGAATLVVTNAAGALNPSFAATQIMAISDHLNFQGIHPLAGINDEKLGPRFPDMSRAYCPRLLQKAQTSAVKLNIELLQGIYAGVHGPEFETSAERRFLRSTGGDVVGMSTVPEVIAANHCSMNVLGFSAITNGATGGADQQVDTLEEVLSNADICANKLRTLIIEMISNGSFDQPKT